MLCAEGVLCASVPRYARPPVRSRSSPRSAPGTIRVVVQPKVSVEGIAVEAKPRADQWSLGQGRECLLEKSPEARQLLARVEPDEQEALVVGEVGVVARPPLLDQLALEQQGLGLGLHLVGLEVGDDVDERPDLRLGDRALAAPLEIR